MKFSKEIPSDISFPEWLGLHGIANQGLSNSITFDTFTGSDIRPLLYLPPNPHASPEQRLGYYTEFGNLQTITISSHRPPAPGRVLGRASVKGYGYGVRTFAGSMIFTRVDREPFTEAYSLSDNDRRDITPYFVDKMPPFHIVLHAQNEMAVQASCAILDITISDFGDAYTIDDLVPEQSYSFVALGFRPFMDRGNWQHKMRDILEDWYSPTVQTPLDLAPDEVRRDIIDEDFYYVQDPGLLE